VQSGRSISYLHHPPSSPYLLSYIHMMMTRGCNPLSVTIKMKSCWENEILADSSTASGGRRLR
jgi:hypothetical protein